jgi:fatty-acyl-CoA synthase
MLVGDWLAKRESLTPDKVALIDVATGERRTYREWNARANAAARVLREEFGVQKGDRVAVLALNCPEYLDVLFAAGKLGAILVPLNWRLTVRELEIILHDCAPTILCHDEAYADTARQVAKLVGVATMPLPVQAGTDAGGTSHPTPAGVSPALRPLSSPRPASPPALQGPAPVTTPDLTLEDPFLILYTSGTTGVPKGAILSHRMVTWNCVNTEISWDVWGTDITPTFAPFFHSGGINVLTLPLVHKGGTVVLLRNSDPGAVLECIERERCTIVFAVPTVFQMMLEHPRFAETDLSSVRFCVTGGSSCPIPIIESYFKRGLTFRQGYGMTEVGVNCFSLAPEDALRKAGSVGRPVFHSEARIVDEGDQDVGVDEVGELILAGPHVCSGYWNRPEATAEALRDGWFHTGDLARRDAEGYYYIVGRKKDLLISGGENIYPAEIEGLLATHPSIAEAAIIGVPDAKWGEVGRAVVVARPGATLTAEEVLAFCDGKLARYKIPRSVVFAPVLPRNAMGKVIKAELREQFG